MDLARVAVRSTIVLVVATVLASGPLVEAVDLTHHRASGAGLGEGSAALAVERVPDQGLRFERGRYASGMYALRVPDAAVHVRSVRGRPIVVYKLRVPALSFTRASTYFLDARHADRRLTLRIDTVSVPPERLDRDAYDAELVLLVRANEEATVLHRGDVTVEVRR